MVDNKEFDRLIEKLKDNKKESVIDKTNKQNTVTKPYEKRMCNKVTKVCKQCGERYSTNKPKLSSFCSNKCRQASYRLHKKDSGVKSNKELHYNN